MECISPEDLMLDIKFVRENPDAIKIWATGGGIWRWDSGRDQHYCSEEI